MMRNVCMAQWRWVYAGGDDDYEEKRAKRRSLIAVMKCQVYLFANTLLGSYKC